MSGHENDEIFSMGHNLSPAHLAYHNSANKKTGMRKKRQEWHPAHDKQLKQLWPQRLEAIAQQMGFSKRAIQKAVDRLGLERGKKGRPIGTIENRERDEQIRCEAGTGISEGLLMARYGLSSRRIKQILQSNGKKE